ncbi:MAG TPA: phosphatase PAP2 family protein [Candidatus Saccharimonadales bacterium]|jgi:undecaprenyl-diphosphatase|nr:phosphatase PAP2 family protein [Candidatus Saccharimonadales bacterium]
MTTQTLITLIADGAVIPVALIAGYALLFLIPKGHRFEAYARILMAGMTAYLLAKLLASVYQPSLQRPFEILGVEPGASYLPNAGFPSDHALFTGFLTLAVWFETKRKGITVVLAALTILVCVGRVLALVHTPLDVVGGLLVASIGALWYFQVPRTTTATSTR